MTDLHWELRHAKESFHAASVSLDCDQATMVTQHGKPMFTKVRQFIPILPFYNKLSYTRGTVRTRTSKHSAVRCCLFIGSKATDKGHVPGNGYTHMWSGCTEYLVWKSPSMLAGDVVVNVGTTWFPLDLWSLDQRSKQI